jgi:hypothetical protein
MSPTHLFGSRLRLAAVFRGAWLAASRLLPCDLPLEDFVAASVVPFSLAQETVLPSESRCLLLLSKLLFI